MKSSKYCVTPEQCARILQSQGFQPEPDQTDQQFQSRLDQFMANNKHLRKEDYDYYINNKQRVLQQLQKKLKIKFALLSVGHIAKWGKTSYSALKALAIKMGGQGVKSGLGQLAQVTVQTGMNQMIKNTFIKTLGSQTTWLVAAVVGSMQIGYEFYRLCMGQICVLDFVKNAGKIIMITATGVVGSAGGAALGAAIGCIGGPVGVFIGIGIGGFIGGIGASKVTQVGIDWASEKIKEMNHHKLYQKALKVLNLPGDFTPKHLQTARHSAYIQFHPDKWGSASIKTQQDMKQKLTQAIQAYQLIINYKE